MPQPYPIPPYQQRTRPCYPSHPSPQSPRTKTTSRQVRQEKRQVRQEKRQAWQEKRSASLRAVYRISMAQLPSPGPVNGVHSIPATFRQYLRQHLRTPTAAPSPNPSPRNWLPGTGLRGAQRQLTAGHRPRFQLPAPTHRQRFWQEIGKISATHSPHGPFPPREGGRGLGLHPLRREKKAVGEIP